MLRVHGCGDHAQFFYVCYNVYRLVAISLFATFALFCLLSIVLLDANKNKLLLDVNTKKKKFHESTSSV